MTIIRNSSSVLSQSGTAAGPGPEGSCVAGKQEDDDEKQGHSTATGAAAVMASTGVPEAG